VLRVQRGGKVCYSCYIDDVTNDSVEVDPYEHIAGRNCTCSLGYSGCRIEAEEMRVSQTVVLDIFLHGY